VKHGVELSGTKADPRRKPADLKHYTQAQLKTYISQLNQFTSRKTQYVADAARKPMTQSSWAKYKALETAYNQKVADSFAKVADIELTGHGMTIGQRMAMMTPKHRQMTNPAVNSPYMPPERQPHNIATAKALEKLTKDMKKRLKPGWENKQIRAARAEFDAMVKIINEPELSANVKGLTNAQFSVIWNYTGFATQLSLYYDARKLMLSNSELSFQSDNIATAVKDANELIAFAKKLNIRS